MKDYKIVKGAGSWITYKLTKDDGEFEEIKFQSKELPELLEKRPELKEAMYGEIVERRIMTYQNQEDVVRVVGEDDIRLDTGD